MSSIPSSAMPHAKAEHPDVDEEQPLKDRAAAQAKKVGNAAETAAGKATQVVKDNPKTAAAIGVAVLAAGAAAIAAPLVISKDKSKSPKAPARKTAAKATAKKAPAKS